jgi:acetoin utilization deacetylase AcuC-like enzyme
LIRVYHDARYEADIGDHVMPQRKFAMVRRAMEACGRPVSILSPEPAGDEDILRVHTPEYLRAVDTGEPLALAQSQKFPWSIGLARAVRWTNGGCIDGLLAALDDGVAGNLASGFHHSHGDHGEGFCTFNGLVIAMEKARSLGRLRRGLVLDMDLHYGNGTAALLSGRRDFYQLSIYGNWYRANLAHRDVDSERAPDTANCWTAPVPNGADGAAYLGILRETFPRALDRARPDAVLYQAGADPFQEDPYSPLKLDYADLMERDRLVFEMCRERGIPVLWVLAGGYTRDTSKVVQVHLNTFLAAEGVFGDRRR